MTWSNALRAAALCLSRREDSCAQARGFAAKASSNGVHAQVLPQDLLHWGFNQLLGTLDSVVVERLAGR
ncbi:hypothetical protein [Rhodoferax saidenbachensis]|uniref:Uncharacterized protein n=1 Tax=Rhodoferax saidenbachensis TaxID=1484693 RepID=A0A1P8KAA3_9BURK|nr:hypothetical protein [Rhodoferax saidenbachensis]APW42936.1 hypothetical protein RS694_10585 [Rhodoferax saidenbachensis]